MKNRITCIAVSFVHLAASTAAMADCMSQSPRYVEMKVESCVSAVTLAQSAIVGKDYTPQEAEQLRSSAANLYIVHAKMLAEVDLIEWYSRGDVRRYAGRRVPIESKARDYLVNAIGSCGELATDKALIFDINPDKPCRDFISTINGRLMVETDPRLILDLPQASYFADTEEFEGMENANKRMQETPVK